MKSKSTIADDILSEKTPAAQETYDLENWDSTVFTSDTLVSNAANDGTENNNGQVKRSMEHISKSLSVAVGKVITR